MFSDCIIENNKYLRDYEEQIKHFIKEKYKDRSEFKYRFFDILKLADKEELTKELYYACRYMEDDTIEDNVQAHLDVYDKLLNYDLTINDNEEFILIVMTSLKVDEKGDTVLGYSTEEEKFYSLLVSLWNEWLNCYVIEENLKEININKFIACCLHEMTWWGYSEEDVKKCREGLGKEDE